MTQLQQPPAQSWWQKLRRGSAASPDWDKVNELVGMGFDPNTSVKALKESNGDVQRATDQMLHDQDHFNPKQTPTEGCVICTEIYVKEQRRIARQALAKQRIAEREEKVVEAARQKEERKKERREARDKFLEERAHYINHQRIHRNCCCGHHVPGGHNPGHNDSFHQSMHSTAHENAHNFALSSAAAASAAATATSMTAAADPSPPSYSAPSNNF